MTIECPKCRRIGSHERADILGEWVVCPGCLKPFSWREARIPDSENESGIVSAMTNGKRRSS